MARRFRDPLGGGRSKLRRPRVQSHNANGTPRRLRPLRGPRSSGAAGRWARSGPRWRTPWSSGKREPAEHVSAGQTEACSDTARGWGPLGTRRG